MTLMIPCKISEIPCVDNNTNDLYSDDFMILIPGINLAQKIQTILPPEILADAVEIGMFNRVGKFVSDRIQFSKLIIDLKLNQNLKNYKSLVDWMKLYGTCVGGDPNAECLYKDVYILVLDPTDGQTIVSYIRYSNCFPIAISNPAFDPTATNVMRVTVNFEVEDFSVHIN